MLGVVPERVWTDAEWERISAGVRSTMMEERWNLYADGDVVVLHRSWTGFRIFELTFSPVPGGGRRITSAVVEGDGVHYRARSDEHERLMVEIVLDSVVFEVRRRDLSAVYDALPFDYS